MCVINHNWSATKQRLHPQSVAEISQLQSAMVDYNWGMNNVALYQKLVNVVNSWSYVTLIIWVRFFETLYKCAAYNVLFIQTTLKRPLKCVSFIVIKKWITIAIFPVHRIKIKWAHWQPHRSLQHCVLFTLPCQLPLQTCPTHAKCHLKGSSANLWRGCIY